MEIGMISYLKCPMVRGRIFLKCLTNVPTKPTKAPTGIKSRYVKKYSFKQFQAIGVNQ
jgi:hypothetical protein